MSFLHKGLVITSGQVIGILANLIANILLARALGPNGIGQFEIFRSSAILVASIFALGTGNAAIYYINKQLYEIGRVVNTLFRTAIIQGLLLGVGFSFAITLLPSYFGEMPLGYAVFFSISVGCHLMVILLVPILIAQLAVKRIFFVTLLGRVTLLLLGAPLAFAGILSPAKGILILAIGNILELGLLLSYLRPFLRLELSFEWEISLKLISYGFKLAAASILTVFIANISLILLRAFLPKDFANIGLYSRAVGISGMVAVIPGALGPLLYSKWAGLKGEIRTRQAEMAVRLSTGLGILLCVLLWVTGEPLIVILYGKSFAGANSALQILAPAVVLHSIFIVFMHLLASDGEAIESVKILAGTVLIISTCCWFAIPLLGIRGAAIAVLLSKLYTAIAVIYVCKRIFKVRITNLFKPSWGDLRYLINAVFEKERPK